jgi:hypothetical protein
VTKVSLQGMFRPVRAWAPAWLASLIRRTGTAVLAPVLYSRRTGHWRSAFAGRALSQHGAPLPWYTYPCIDFLQQRDYAGRTVLEFGAGQSTLWWAARAARVVALEDDASWLRTLRQQVPPNVQLHGVDGSDASRCVAEVRRVLADSGIAKFDVIVIDGLCREALIDTAIDWVGPEGVIVCDNAEGYGIHAGFLARGFQRVDFFGNAPAVVRPHCTSLFFRGSAFVFNPAWPIPDIGEPG